VTKLAPEGTEKSVIPTVTKSKAGITLSQLLSSDQKVVILTSILAPPDAVNIKRSPEVIYTKYSPEETIDARNVALQSFAASDKGVMWVETTEDLWVFLEIPGVDRVIYHHTEFEPIGPKTLEYIAAVCPRNPASPKPLIVEVCEDRKGILAK